MTIPKKRQRISNLTLREISSVDRPAQVGAVSVLMKRAGEQEMSTTDIRKNAAAVATGGDPAFTVTQYEDAMFERAAELGKELGCTPEQALVKGLRDDSAIRDLAHASEVARCGAYATGGPQAPRAGHGVRLDAATLEAGYPVLFGPLIRAAHVACLQHARLTRDDGWPTVQACLDFAKLYGVPGAELAAFFGFVGVSHGGTIWVDALRGPVPSYTARQQATRPQALALGFTQAVAELPA